MRGFPNKSVETAFSKARSVLRANLLKPKTLPPENPQPKHFPTVKRPIFTLRFNPRTTHLRNLTHMKFREFQLFDTFRELFPNPPLIAFKRQLNIKDILVRSSLKPIADPPPSSGFHLCKSLKCSIHTHTQPTSTFHSSVTNASFKIFSSLSCSDSNVIYLITCKKCHHQYVGETGRPFSERAKEHIRYARLRYNQPTSLYFNSSDHTHSDLAIFPIEKVKLPDPLYRKKT